MPKLKEKLEAAMKKLQDFPKLREQVKMTITPEGLRIELIETQGGFFFENGSSALTDRGKELLGAIAKEIGVLPNHLLIGAYQLVPHAAQGKYTNWELSTDRANSARRLMGDSGLRADRPAMFEASPIASYGIRPTRSILPTGAYRSSFNIRTGRLARTTPPKS